jgi:hypothetical protein
MGLTENELRFNIFNGKQPDPKEIMDLMREALELRSQIKTLEQDRDRLALELKQAGIWSNQSAGDEARMKDERDLLAKELGKSEKFGENWSKQASIFFNERNLARAEVERLKADATEVERYYKQTREILGRTEQSLEREKHRAEAAEARLEKHHKGGPLAICDQCPPPVVLCSDDKARAAQQGTGAPSLIPGLIPNPASNFTSKAEVSTHALANPSVLCVECGGTGWKENPYPGAMYARSPCLGCNHFSVRLDWIDQAKGLHYIDVMMDALGILKAEMRHGAEMGLSPMGRVSVLVREVQEKGFLEKGHAALNPKDDAHPSGVSAPLETSRPTGGDGK